MHYNDFSVDERLKKKNPNLGLLLNNQLQLLCEKISDGKESTKIIYVLTAQLKVPEKKGEIFFSAAC